MLKRLIAHHIVKEKNKTAAALTARKTVLPATTDLADLLIDQLSESFKNRNPFAGLFRTEGATPKETSEAATEKTDLAFRQSLIAYLEVNSDDAFVDFTTTAAGILRDEMAGQPLATGGYVVFAEYQAGNESYLMTALLTTKATPSFDKDLNLIATNPLDFEHLRHGARIRLKGVRANLEGVVQFASQRAEGVSDYFVAFLGCEPILRPAVQAQLLLGVVNSMKLSESTRKKVKEGIVAQAGEARRENRTMTLTEIAGAAPVKDRPKVLSVLTDPKNGLAGEFYPPLPAVMKPFVRFAFNGAGLRLEFDLTPWANRIRVDDQNTLTITKVPPELVKQLREEV